VKLAFIQLTERVFFLVQVCLQDMFFQNTTTPSRLKSKMVYLINLTHCFSTNIQALLQLLTPLSLTFKGYPPAII